MEKLIELAATMLEQYADSLGNAGCNDWDWPADFGTLEARKSLLDYCELDADNHWYLVGTSGPPDWMVCRALAQMLRESAKGASDAE